MKQRDKDKKIVFEQELVKLEKELENSNSYPWNSIEAIRYIKAELKKLGGHVVDTNSNITECSEKMDRIIRSYRKN